MLISDKIFILIKERGLTQKEFSIRTGIPQSTISDWKGKRLNPSSDKINIICRVLGISPAELLAEPGDENVNTDYIVINRNTEEHILMEAFRKMDDSSRELMLQFAEKLAGK